MKIFPPLLALILLAPAVMASSQPDKQSTTAEHTPAPSVKKEDPSDKLKNIKVSPEEKAFIVSQCRQFATEDGITEEHTNAYLDVCVSELTIAVKSAIYERKQKATVIIPARTPNAPQAM